MIAQALLHQMTLITKDQTIQRYEVPVCWEGLEDLSLD
jgi:PIN domain nuclease of toxin-antitoxin system